MKPDNGLIANRPNIGRPGGNRPNIDLPGGNRPGTNRPNVNRPNIDRNKFKTGDFSRKNVNFGDINIGSNNVIGNRPSWVNIDRNRVNNIGNSVQRQIGGLHGYGNRYPGRVNYWGGWGNGVRHHIHHNFQHRGYFGASWWGVHRHACGGWHYGYGFARRPFGYWWTVPTFAACTSWFTAPMPAAVWSEPVYYDYGQDGNVYYENNNVYVNGESVATQDEYAQATMALATVPPPEDEQEAEQAEWMALGTFAMSSDEKDYDPTRLLQLAVNKEGIVSGTYFNTETDDAKSVQGRVDMETQRVAFRIGESEDLVVETGLYNLTQDNVPAMVHLGPDQTQQWLLVRLDEPDESELESQE